MFYIVQENTFKEHNHKFLIEALIRMNLEFELVRYVPFIYEIEHTTKRKDVWCWGGVGMARAAQQYGWKPGTMFNDNHDFEVYSKHYGHHMLNHDGIVINFTDDVPKGLDAFFARPTKDTKSFSGQLFMDYSWKEWVNECLENGTSKLLTAETRVLLAPLKDIQQEVRCWVVDGKVVSASRYKLGSRVVYQNYDDETYYTDFAQKMVDIYQPAKAFVLDICLFNGELKIVEVNCINCSGFYAVNIQKVISKLEETF